LDGVLQREKGQMGESQKEKQTNWTKLKDIKKPNSLQKGGCAGGQRGALFGVGGYLLLPVDENIKKLQKN